MPFSLGRTVRRSFVLCVVAIALLASYGQAGGVVRAVSVDNPKSPPPAAVRTHPPQNIRLSSLTARERAAVARFFRALALAAFFDALWQASRVTPWGAPAPISSQVCPPGAVHDEIEHVFAAAAAWFQSIAVRESGCDPGADNPISDAGGVGQLLGHDDLLLLVCPGRDPARMLFDAWCNIRASFELFRSSGVSPWALY